MPRRHLRPQLTSRFDGIEAFLQGGENRAMRPSQELQQRFFLFRDFHIVYEDEQGSCQFLVICDQVQQAINTRPEFSSRIVGGQIDETQDLPD